MDFIGDKLRAHQRTRGTSGKRNAGDTRNACYRARIGGDFFQSLVAGDGGYGQKLQVRIAMCQEHGDGIVMARVAIEDDFLCR